MRICVAGDFHIYSTDNPWLLTQAKERIGPEGTRPGRDVLRPRSDARCRTQTVRRESEPGSGSAGLLGRETLPCWWLAAGVGPI